MVSTYTFTQPQLRRLEASLQVLINNKLLDSDEEKIAKRMLISVRQGPKAGESIAHVYASDPEGVEFMEKLIEGTFGVRPDDI